jgi:tyrosyl-tRNA synthetase
MPLLVGTDGVQKMSQSLGNYVGITDPPGEMFGKLVRVPDELLAEYRRLALDFFRDPAEADRVAAGLAEGSLEPWAEKRRMAREIVDLYHGQGAGERAEVEFDRVHKEGELPEEVREVSVTRAAVIVQKQGGVVVLDHAALLTELGLAASKSEARRLIDQEGVRRDGVPIKDYELRVDVPDRASEGLVNSVWQVGKRRFARVAGLS